MSQLFESGAQNIGVLASASVLPMTIQGWFSLGWTGLVTLLVGAEIFALYSKCLRSSLHMVGAQFMFLE